MDFRATPVNVLTLLLAAFAVYVVYSLSKEKLDSNLPILFYVGLLIFTNSTDRHINSYLFGGGVALALMLRFEFLNGQLTRLVLWLEMLAIAGIAFGFVREIFD